MNLKFIQGEVGVWVSWAGPLPSVRPSLKCDRLLFIPYTVSFVKWSNFGDGVYDTHTHTHTHGLGQEAGGMRNAFKKRADGWGWLWK